MTILQRSLSPEEIAAVDLVAPFDLMKFTLTYDGELPSAGNRNHRVREKWDIRKYLHPQILELWQTHPVLKKLSETIAPNRGGFLELDKYIDRLTEAEVPSGAQVADTPDTLLRNLKLVCSCARALPLVPATSWKAAMVEGSAWNLI